jgi:hypothetical protein
MPEPRGDVGAERSRRARKRQTNASARVDVAARGITDAVSNPYRIDEDRAGNPDDSGRPPLLRFH